MSIPTVFKITLTAALMAILTASCAIQYPQVEYLIFGGDDYYPVDEVSEIEDAVPFEIVYPRNLPDDVFLEIMRVVQPPAVVDDRVKHLHVGLVMVYGNERRSFRLQLEERINHEPLGYPGAQVISMTLVDGSRPQPRHCRLGGLRQRVQTERLFRRRGPLFRGIARQRQVDRRVLPLAQPAIGAPEGLPRISAIYRQPMYPIRFIPLTRRAGRPNLVDIVVSPVS